MHERDRHAADDRVAREARDWVVRLASGTVSDAELAAFRAWHDAAPAHGRAFARERSFWQQLAALDARPGALAGTERGSARPRSRRAVLAGAGALAAGGAGLIVAPRLARLWRADVSTGFGEQRRVSLPDGTAALLNTDSALALGFRPGVRRVALLQGEALFEVTPDAVPFRVAALGGEVEALGTGFAVRAVAGEAAVTVTDGRVRVSAGGGPDGAVEVRPREQARYRDAGGPVRVAAVDLDEVLSWRAGRIVFEGRPFGEALAELARYVPETVVLADRRAAAEPVSAVFSVGQAVAAIAALAATQNLTMRRIPGLAILIS